jgi:hypothetical protein
MSLEIGNPIAISEQKPVYLKLTSEGESREQSKCEKCFTDTSPLRVERRDIEHSQMQLKIAYFLSLFRLLLQIPLAVWLINKTFIAYSSEA